MKHHEIFRGLADETRLRVVVLLLERELCVCDLLGVLHLPQSTVSRHMTRLKSSGLVIDRRVGRWVHYKLVDSDTLTALKKLLQEQFLNAEPFKTDRIMLKKYVAAGHCAAMNGAADRLQAVQIVQMRPMKRRRRAN